MIWFLVLLDQNSGCFCVVTEVTTWSSILFCFVTGVENVFQHLAGKINEVSFAFNAQAISQSVQGFDYNPKCFREWVIQIKMYNLLAYRFRQTFACRF